MRQKESSVGGQLQKKHPNNRKNFTNNEQPKNIPLGHRTLTKQKLKLLSIY